MYEGIFVISLFLMVGHDPPQPIQASATDHLFNKPKTVCFCL